MTQKLEEQEQQEHKSSKNKSDQLKAYHKCDDSPQKYCQILDEQDRCYKCKKYLSTQTLGVCFQYNKIAHNGEQIISYLFLLKYSFVFFVIFVIVYTLPLSLICNKLKTGIQSQIIISLSMVVLAENDKLNYLSFFLFPIFIIHSLYFLLVSYKIRLINHKNNQLKRFPTNHAVLLKFPKAISSQEQIAQSIESWFYSQIKHNPLCLDLIPQLLKQTSQNSQSSSSSSGSPETLASRIIQKIIFSYSLQEYRNLLQEFEYFSNEIKQEKKRIDSRQIERYLTIYNIKKNIAKNMSFLNYCVVIFKKSKYADYFAQKTTPNTLQLFFRPEKFRVFRYGAEEIAVQKHIFPTEIYWQQMHLNQEIVFKQNLYSNIIWILCLAVGSSIQYSLTFLRLSNSFILSNQINTIIISSIIINIIVSLFTILIHNFTQRQIFITYVKEKKSFIIKIAILNVLTLTIVPVITYVVQFPSNFYSGEAGILISQIFNLSIFLFFSILMMYLPIKTSKIQRDKQFKSTKTIKIQFKLTFIITIVSITFIIAPLLPVIICISAGSTLLYYFLEKINLSNIYKEASERGSELIKQVTTIYYNLFLLFLISFILFYSFNGYTSYWKIQDIIIVIITFVLFLIVRFANSNILQDKLFGCFNNQSLKGEIVDEDYSKIKNNFLIQYEDFNFLFNYELKQAQKASGYSERMKIYQQLNTMSKTLSLSLKQKLFNNPDPIIKNPSFQRKNTEQEQVNDIYFQYEQKIKMSKSKPKIPIPPLFKREDPSARKEENNLEMANFNSIFSDSQQKKKVKKTIKTNLKLQNQIKK